MAKKEKAGEHISGEFYDNHYNKKSWREARRKQFLYCLSRLESLSLFRSGHKTLDVGCGSGELSLLLKQKYDVNPFGIEINHTAIRRAKLNGVSVKHADLEKKWPHKANVFDSVLGVEIIEHVVNPDHFILEAKRVLKPGGVLILTTPNLACWFNRILFLFGYQPFFLEASTKDKTVGLDFTRKLTPNRTPVGHVRCFTMRAMKDLLTLHGFKDVQIIGGKVDCLPRFMSSLDHLFSFVPSLSSDLIIIAHRL